MCKNFYRSTSLFPGVHLCGISFIPRTTDSAAGSTSGAYPSILFRIFYLLCPQQIGVLPDLLHRFLLQWQDTSNFIDVLQHKSLSTFIFSLSVPLSSHPGKRGICSTILKISSGSASLVVVGGGGRRPLFLFNRASTFVSVVISFSILPLLLSPLYGTSSMTGGGGGGGGGGGSAVLGTFYLYFFF